MLTQTCDEGQRSFSEMKTIFYDPLFSSAACVVLITILFSSIWDCVRSISSHYSRSERWWSKLEHNWLINLHKQEPRKTCCVDVILKVCHYQIKHFPREYITSSREACCQCEMRTFRNFSLSSFVLSDNLSTR